MGDREWMEGEKRDTAEEEGQSSAKGFEERGKSKLKRPNYFCRYFLFVFREVKIIGLLEKQISGGEFKIGFFFFTGIKSATKSSLNNEVRDDKNPSSLHARKI